MNPVLPTELEPPYWELLVLSHSPDALLNMYVNLSINSFKIFTCVYRYLVKYGPVPIFMSKAVTKKTLFKENVFSLE